MHCFGEISGLGLLMRANRNARQAYAKMIVDPNYVAPQRWDAIDPMAFDALLLPGGHRARGMRNYLESDILQRLVAHFFDEEKPVAAICHGVLLAARSISKRTGRSVLNGYRTTALTWAFERVRGRLRASRDSGIQTIIGPIWNRTDNRRASCPCSRK
jgi:putative intracellular protease/amidase